MIQDVFKMLNQFAVKIRKLPVNQCLSHPDNSWSDAKPFLWNAEPQRRRQAFGTRMVYRETFLQIQVRPVQHPYPQELNPWSLEISEPFHSSTQDVLQVHS